MALVKCSECAKEISSEAKSCPHCGKPRLVVGKRSGGSDRTITLVAALIGLLVVASYLGSNSSNPESSQAASVDFAKINSSVKDLLKAGVVTKIDPNLNEAFVSPVAWYGASFEQKKIMGYVLGHYCGQKKGTDTAWVNIRHANSGKVIGKWSKAWGFEAKD